jgi:hypothetical protein
MCGCLGKYTVNPAHRDYVGAYRGYDVSDEEVSERSVKIIAKKVLSNPHVVYEHDYAYVRDTERDKMQVVYFVKTS